MERFEEFNLVGRDLYSLGLIDSGGGSISVKDGEKMFITKKNAMLGHLKEDDILEVSLSEEGGGSDFSLVHRAIYKETSYNAIIMANPPYAIALSLSVENKIIPQDFRGQSLLKSIPVVRTRDRFSLDELSKTLPPIYKSGYMVSVVKENGSIAVGTNLSEALQFTTCLEASSKISVINKLMTSEAKREPVKERRTAIPPGIGVMDRSRRYKRGFGR